MIHYKRPLSAQPHLIRRLNQCPATGVAFLNQQKKKLSELTCREAVEGLGSGHFSSVITEIKTRTGSDIVCVCVCIVSFLS